MEQLAIAWQPIAVAAVMMVMDLLTGFASAAKDKVINSGKMRDGLWHKAGYFGLIALAAAWELGSAWLNFEVHSIGLNMTIPEIPAVSAVCVFIVVTEVVSIVENLCILNPNIARLPVIETLKPHDPAAPDLVVEIEDEDARAA